MRKLCIPLLLPILLTVGLAFSSGARAQPNPPIAWLDSDWDDPKVKVLIVEDFATCSSLNEIAATRVNSAAPNASETFRGVARGAMLVALMFAADFKGVAAENYFNDRYAVATARLNGLLELGGGELSAIEADFVKCAALNPIQAAILNSLRSQP
jgi:hypothetical protein